MKTHLKSLLSVSIALVALCVFQSCRDEEGKPPVVTTEAVCDITGTSARFRGTVYDDEKMFVSDRGFCWALDTLPDLNDAYVSAGSGLGDFSANVSGLEPDVTYHVRAYAVNYSRTGYGNEVLFTTENTLDIPCSPLTNSVQFLSQTQNYTAYAGSGGIVYGNYGLVGNGNNSDLQIGFVEPPVSGKYITAGATSFLGPKECSVNGVFGSIMGYHYVAAGGDTVYVIKTAPGKYSMSFCNLHFSSAGGPFDFYTDGNLTVE